MPVGQPATGGLKGASRSAKADDVAERRFASFEMMKIAKRFSDHKHWNERSE